MPSSSTATPGVSCGVLWSDEKSASFWKTGVARDPLTSVTPIFTSRAATFSHVALFSEEAAEDEPAKN